MRLLIGIIILSGIFFYNRYDSVDMFYPAQYALFVAIAGMLISYLIFKKSKWMGILFAICSIGFLKTYLLQHAPVEYLFKVTLFSYSAFLIYYFARQLELKEDILKWFLIPACLNIALILIQKFDHNFLSFIPLMDRTQITGFLGNRSITACYLAMTMPLFIKHLKWGIPFLLLALFCSSLFAFIICVIIMAFYFSKINPKLTMRLYLGVFTLALSCGIVFEGKVVQSLNIRASETSGVLDGIKHNPILGWGVGSFEPIMIKVAERSKENYFGRRLSATNEVLGHPHNELLQAWWNYGIAFPVIVIIYALSLLRLYAPKKLILYSILLTGALCSIGDFLSPPAWILLLLTLGIYENQENKEVISV